MEQEKRAGTERGPGTVNWEIKRAFCYRKNNKKSVRRLTASIINKS